MADFLLELLSEEIPAMMQLQAANQLEMRIGEHLILGGFVNEVGIETDYYSTPRRLIISLGRLPDISEAKNEIRKGPRVDAPQQALDGFLRSCGLKSKDDLKIETDKKGDFYVAEMIGAGRSIEDFLTEILPEVIGKFNWHKSMLWGDGDFRWVRPLHSITAVLDGKPVIFEVGGIKSGSHSVKDFKSYSANLEKQGIIIDHGIRYKKIKTDAQK
ncbi:MAG: glycine--tRNA ligase subunit beta, partial [Proteobacteria bacterium]|nr:glycine--tRNA ligase subunit beta [Pseudomonadota bacterium]